MAHESTPHTTCWRYQIIKHQDPDGRVWYALHELHLTHEQPTAVSAEPTTFVGDTPEEIVRALKRALQAATAHGAFTPPAAWDIDGQRHMRYCATEGTRTGKPTAKRKAKGGE